MEKFNQILGAIGNDENCGCNGDVPCNCGDACKCQKDTDSDIGQSGAINPPEENNSMVIIHLDGGVEIHLPLKVAEVIKQALSNESESTEE